MSLNMTHVYLAAALLAAPVALGVASQTDTLGLDGDDGPTQPLTPAASSAGEGEAIETFEGEVPEDVTTGELDLRIDRGPVKVVGWDEDRYEIAVVADGNSSEGETETEFEENVEDDKISLSLVVDHQQTSPAEVSIRDQEYGDAGERAIVAHVPERLTYDTVYACEGQHTSLPGEDLVSEDDDEECVESSETALVQGSIHVQVESDDGLNASWGLLGLEGEEATIDAHNGHVVLEELDFATIDVGTHNGAIEAADVTADQLDVASHNGAIQGVEVTADELDVASHNGAIDLETDAGQAVVDTHNGGIQLDGEIASLEAVSHNGDIGVASPVLANGTLATHNGAIDVKMTPGTSGQLEMASENGHVDVRLGHAEDIGYAVEGTTDNGDVEIRLVDGTDSEDDVEAEDEYDNGEHEEARTAGYEDKPIQLGLTAKTDNGAIEIVEETAEDGDEETAEDAGSSAGLAALD